MHKKPVEVHKNAPDHMRKYIMEQVQRGFSYERLMKSPILAEYIVPQIRWSLR